MSKCGGLNSEGGPKDEDFDKNRVTFEQLCEDPALFTSPDLVVRIHGRYMSIQTASRLVWAELLFNKPFPNDVLERHLEREAEAGKKSSSWFSWRRTPSKKQSAGQDAMKVVSEPDLLNRTSMLGSSAVSETDGDLEAGSGSGSGSGSQGSDGDVDDGEIETRRPITKAARLVTALPLFHAMSCWKHFRVCACVYVRRTNARRKYE